MALGSGSRVERVGSAGSRQADAMTPRRRLHQVVYGLPVEPFAGGSTRAAGPPAQGSHEPVARLLGLPSAGRPPRPAVLQPSATRAGAARQPRVGEPCARGALSRMEVHDWKATGRSDPGRESHLHRGPPGPHVPEYAARIARSGSSRGGGWTTQAHRPVGRQARDFQATVFSDSLSRLCLILWSLRPLLVNRSRNGTSRMPPCGRQSLRPVARNGIA